jgi:hypothetical protein
MVPRMQTVVAPLTQTVPSVPVVISMVAARPSLAPWETRWAGGGGAGAGEPLSDGGVHAPAGGILGHSAAGSEGAHLEVVPGTVGVGTDRADHRGRDEGEVGFEGEDLVGRGQSEHGPARAVVDSLVGEDTVTADAERGDDLLQVRVVERAERRTPACQLRNDGVERAPG